MIAPAALVVISPILWGILLGYKFVSGMLAGNICSGI
jgi:Na+/H+-translocating membrane pyrophosphatase